MKKCTKCEKLKSLTAFSFKSKKTKRRHSECKSCHNVYHKSYYNKNKDYYLFKNKEKNKLIVEYVRSVKEGFPCADCDQYYPYYVMDFDHIIDKSFTIGTWLSGNLTWEKLHNEMAKCEVVCSNCHRIRTYKRFKGH